MQKRSNIVILIIAVLFGLLGVMFVTNYVGAVKTSVTEVPMKKVVVAAQNIPENVTITTEMVQVMNLPSEYVLPQAYTKQEDVVGAMTAVPLIKGEQIVQGRVSKGEDKSGFSYGIPKGKRAVSVGINHVSGVSGLIRPKDKVDVLATISIPEDNSGAAQGEATATDGKTEINVRVKMSWHEELELFQKVARKLLEGKRIVSFDGKNITFTLFQNVDVLAVGTTVTNQPKTVDENGLLQNKSNNDGEEAKTVTLCLDAEQVDLLTNAEQVGSIKFDLRNPGDDQVVELKPIIEYKLEDILKAVEQVKNTSTTATQN